VSLRYLSVCSGIEAATVAWHPLGWEAAAYSEIEAFPRAVLKHHYPDTPLHGDFTTIGADEYGPINLLVGGTPCQSFSVAGLRGGMDDERGQLALQFLKLLDRTRARWMVWENVPGILSSNGGRDFGSFLGGLVELGYGFAYRVLDAQHFGVPQRRRRVFVVGYLGDWRRAAAVLFERHSLSWNPAPRRQAGQGTSGRIARSLAIRGRDGTPQAELGDEVANAILTPNGGRAGVGVGAILEASTGDVSHCLNAGGMGRQDYETETLIAHSLRAEGFDASEDGTGRGTPLVPVSFTGGASECLSLENTAHPVTGRNGDPGMVCFTAKDHGADASDISPTLRSGSHSGSHANGGVMPAVAFTASEQANSYAWERDVYPTLNAQIPNDTSNIQQGLRIGSAVRRLTPRECERLQGFPDDYSLIPHRGKLAADGPRYKALGNSMAVPVMHWIGSRIAQVEALQTMSKAA
jgi:DNA (cytosine-5)-methyltransferase 1